MPRLALFTLLALALACSPSRRDDSEDDSSGPDAGGTVEETPDAGPVDPQKCGNGVLDPNEACDWAIPAGPGACPADCDDGNECTSDVLHGTPSLCTARCVNGPVACRSGDGCCPDGCTSASDSDCGVITASCGNGSVDPGETCDRAIAPGQPGSCPTSCNDGNTCTADRLSGSASACTASCVSTAITTCQSHDGCCPSGCVAANDSDCNTCGNGLLDPGETCDGDCPTSCDDGNACTTDGRSGSDSLCNVRCSNVAITSCQSNDGCCPSGCTSANDTDCTPPQTTGIGAPCTADGQCGSGGTCITEALDGWTGGYCSKTCLTDGECGTGGWCRGSDGFFTQGYCFAGCTSNASCRGGYQCYDRFYEQHNICAPAGVGGAAVGAACTNASQCSGGPYAMCLTEQGSGYKGGYCTKELRDGTTCPSGSHLANVSGGFGTCMADCSASPQCRGQGGDGYLCYDTDGDGKLECDVGATGTGAIGDPCTGAWNCSGWEKGTCGTVANGWPGGYCLLSCKTGGCPTGTNCVQLNTSIADSYFCLKACTPTSNTCRAGYTCKDRGGATTLECAP